MVDYEKTVLFTSEQSPINAQIVTIFDSDFEPYSVDLASFQKTTVTFGREEGNDIQLKSPLVSRMHHGAFVYVNNSWMILDNNSTNGIIFNDTQIKKHELFEGDFYRIDDGIETIKDGVLFVVSTLNSANKWNTIPTQPRMQIGRATDCEVILPHISISKHHALITYEGNSFFITDQNSTNGVVVNGQRLLGKQKLHEKDVIIITNSRLIFTSKYISYCIYKTGITVDASDVVIERKQSSKKIITCNHVNLNIRPGELVSIIGGSGAGKSTILNALCGYLKPANGSVYINGADLYKNFDSLKKVIGYVPQSDIVYDNLSLYDMLSYTAKLRLPRDASVKDRERAIEKAIALVELTDKKNSLIRNLSGGQKKRASIAVELLSDPSLLFLDEPASGLDPGTERNLMISLRQMADNGKTVILVTHSTLQLKLCDKIIFMGRGGRLCFCGTYEEALSFFKVSDIVDVYNMITDNSEAWEQRFRTVNETGHRTPSNNINPTSKKKENIIGQLGVLCSRYFKLILNDRQRLLLLLAQAPILAVLISLVSDKEAFRQYEMTKSLLFALSCSAFWIGMLNALQEICKERVILRREYMTGLSLDAYILSKIAVLGVLCFVQSLCVTGAFSLLIGLPGDFDHMSGEIIIGKYSFESILLPPFLEMLVTTFLTALASASMGLLVSSLFTNPDRAMTVAPILLMPQILYSGLIFKLNDATKGISWFTICRWSMEGYGTTSDLNELDLQLQRESGIPLFHEEEDFFIHTSEHLLKTWGILIAFTFIFLIISRVILISVKKESK